MGLLAERDTRTYPRRRAEEIDWIAESIRSQKATMNIMMSEMFGTAARRSSAHDHPAAD